VNWGAAADLSFANCIVPIGNIELRTWSLRVLRQLFRLALSGLHVVAAATSAALKSRAALQLENLALRHQLGVLRRSVKRPKLTSADRLLWTWLCAPGAIGDLPWSLSSRKPSLAGTVRAFGCSGPGKFVMASPGVHRCRWKSVADSENEPRESTLGSTPHPRTSRCG
jgi:hypothetical protein